MTSASIGFLTVLLGKRANQPHNIVQIHFCLKENKILKVDEARLALKNVLHWGKERGMCETEMDQGPFWISVSKIWQQMTW